MNRNLWIDLLRGISAFGIVGCHLALQPRSFWGEAVHTYCELNVAIFAAISGLFFKPKLILDESRLSLALTRLRRLLPIYFLWTVIYLAVGVAFDLISSGRVEPKFTSLFFWITVLLSGNSCTHLWFVAVLIWVDVFLAFFWPRYMPSLLEVSIGMFFVGGATLCSGWWACYPQRFFGFFILGMALHGYNKMRGSCHVLWFGCLVLALFAYPIEAIRPAGFLRDALIVVPLLISCCIASQPKESMVHSIAKLLGETSFGVFLVHPIITAANGLWVRRVFDAPYGVLSVMLDWILSWLLAFIVVLCLLRSRRIRKFIS